MRVAFSIVLNGLHHFTHNNYLEKMVNMFDYVVVSEGAVMGNIGTAGWTGRVDNKFHRNGRSIDGTYGYLTQMEDKYDNLYVVASDGLWSGKDEMVNACIDQLKELVSFDTEPVWLWEIDPDEQWEEFKLQEIENILDKYNADCAITKFHQMMGHGKIAVGPDWGGNHVPRVWRWKGQSFRSHAPAILDNWNGKSINVTHKFIHYSYHFEQDVKFKGDWYFKDPQFLNRWKQIQGYEKDNIITSDIIPNIPGARSTIVNVPSKEIPFSYTVYEDFEPKSIFARNGQVFSIFEESESRVKSQNNYTIYFNTLSQLLEGRDNIKVLDFNSGVGINYVLLDSVIQYLAMDSNNKVESNNMKTFDYHGMDDYSNLGDGYFDKFYGIATEINNPNFILFDKKINMIYQNYDIIILDGKGQDFERDLQVAISSKVEKTWVLVMGYDEDVMVPLIRKYWNDKNIEEFMYLTSDEGGCILR